MYIENWPWISQNILETVIKSCKFLKGIKYGRIFCNFRVWLYSRSVLPLHIIWQNTCFLWPLFSCMTIESLIVFLYWKVWVRQNPNFSLFYTAYLSCFIKHSKKRNLQDCFQKHKNVWWEELLEIDSFLARIVQYFKNCKMRGCIMKILTMLFSMHWYWNLLSSIRRKQ